MLMWNCAFCKVHACIGDDRERMPQNCPIRQEDLQKNITAEYAQPEHHSFFVESSAVEAAGYGQWPRLREVMELSRRMGYRKLGLAFCVGLAAEAEVCARLLTQSGFVVESVVCKNGAIPKRSIGLRDDQQVHPGQPENICNPIGQARLLELAETEFNIALGLCVGHDSLFFQHSHVPVTVLVAKDRALGHNPVAALNPCNRYLADRLVLEEQL